MAKNSIRDFSATSSSNTDIQSVDIDENCAASGINNAIRELMADLKDVSTGTVNLETPGADQLNVDNLRLDGNTISSTDTNGNITLDPNGTGVIDAVGTLQSDGLTVDGDVTLNDGSPNLRLQDTDVSRFVDIMYGTRVTTFRNTMASGEDMDTVEPSFVFSFKDDNEIRTAMTIADEGKVAIKDAAFVASGVAQVNVPAAGVAIINADTNGHYRWNYQSSNQSMYWSNGSNQASLSSSGTWTDASDVAYKKDITDATYGITTVKAMQPRFYYMKDDAIEDDGRQLGFIAQELEVVVPEVVSGEDGSKGVSYGHLTAVLTKALQEAVAKIETLETKVAALENAE